VTRRYSPRRAPGKCQWTTEACRELLEVSALTALRLEARGAMSPFAEAVLGLMGADAERWLGTDGKDVAEVIAPAEGRRRY